MSNKNGSVLFEETMIGKNTGSTDNKQRNYKKVDCWF